MAPVIHSKALLEKLRDSSLKDALTGLYNRRYLEEYLDRLKEQHIRNKQNIGVLMIDMDHFKRVNDTYGHDAGDIVLKELSFILSDTVRKSDLVIRFGGEEFIVFLINVEGETRTIEIAEKLRQRIEATDIEIGHSNTLSKTISIGASMFPDDSKSIWQVIKFADVALYQAKDTGRNKVIRFTQEMQQDKNASSNKG